MTLWLKLKGWLIGIGAFIAALAAAWLYGRQGGKASEKAATAAAKNESATAKATADHLESRHETDLEVSTLPDAPAQAVGDADPGTAAGKLRDDGWVRD